MEKSSATITPAILAALSFVLFLFVIITVDNVVFEGKDFSHETPEFCVNYQQYPKNREMYYKDWEFYHVRSVFEWNLRSGKYLFWLSVLISVSGIVFAYAQFRSAERTEHLADRKPSRDSSPNPGDGSAGDVGASDGNEGPSTDADILIVKTQLASIAFKAKSIAALTLFVSIVYCIMYVVFVYRLEPVPPFNH